jgi:serine/threonine protein kinase
VGTRRHLAGTPLANIFSTMATTDERDEHGHALASIDSTTPLPGSADHPAGAPADLALRASAIGSGLLARQPTPQADETIAVTKLCPQCGSEYETGDRFCPRDGSPLRPKSGGDPLIGRVIADRYLVLARLGEGGMGRVYLAEHVKMTRQCAVKVMNPALMNDSESLARFAREASSAARILHPNVAAVFDYGEADKIVYLVMEYVDGRSLSSILTDGPLDPRRAIDIARQIADGLSAAHELGIVHRDLKPDNVIVSSTRSGKETPKVVDFGIAKALSDSPQDALTRSGLVIGTPEYMSPEQLLGDPVDPRADIYSLGCILYQMLTGVQPFAAESREQMIRRRLHEAPPHVRDVLPDLPRRLDTLIVHMLSRSPAERLASAAEVRDALDPSLALSGWDPSAITGSRSTAQTVHEPIRKHGDPSLQPTMPMPRQRSNVKRMVAGGVGGAVVLIAAMVASSQRGGTPVPPARAADTLHVGAPAVASLALPAATRKDSLIKLDSSTLKKPKPAEPTPEDLVRRPFAALDAAIRTGNAQSLGEKFPMLPAGTKKFLGDLFQQYDNVRCNTTYGQSSITGDHADLPVTLRIHYSARGSGAPTSTNVPLLAKLVRHSEKWQIAELLPRS